ncbi:MULTISPECIES: PRD domain-containing protein [Clostridium]|uniref:BglG family transcription antiterminator LicT n=1 Tax=Clostridium TaxID=1485 RepID=UPI00189A0E98|nr:MULTISPECIES: PRD domain-containing protein [Clostridium]MCR1950716.1 PRD domain-containing protein [Clostridium sp. DSM 100503]MDI9216738.1 PRD domain-containing protein [Clostridium tertium]
MRITRIINNNVICAVNERNQERILLGSGIGFQKKKGDEVDKKKIEKEFFLKSKNVAGKLYSLLTQIPMEYMRVTENIIKYAQQKLDHELNENVYLTLTDHISFAVSRQKSGLQFSNALLWEVKRFYPDEFNIGLKALELINEEFDVELPEDEAASIAMHVVNSELGSESNRDTIKVTELIQNVLNIIRYQYKIDFKEDDLYYTRFITHLKFFAYRVLNNSEEVKEVDKDFEEIVKVRYPKEYGCSLKIADLIKNKYNRRLSGDELVYLTVHIKRITINEN